jgi:hypothetical protein
VKNDEHEDISQWLSTYRPVASKQQSVILTANQLIDDLFELLRLPGLAADNRQAMVEAGADCRGAGEPTRPAGRFTWVGAARPSACAATAPHSARPYPPRRLHP